MRQGLGRGARRRGAIPSPNISSRPRGRDDNKGSQLMTMRPSVRDAMLAAVPSLRAFAISLCGNVDRADDLVQETLLRAMANIDSFQPGTNMSAWLFTILRNLFRSEYRKRRREVEDSDGSYAESLKSHPEQQAGWNSRNSASRSPSCRLISARRSYSSARRASPMRRPPPSASARWERSRAGSIGRARGSPSCSSIDGTDDFGPDRTTRAILSAGGRG